MFCGPRVVPVVQKKAIFGKIRKKNTLQLVIINRTYLVHPIPIPWPALIYTYIHFFFPSHLLSSPFYYLSRLVVTQIRGHIAGSSPPLTTTVRALHFYREKISALSSLVNSRRIVLTHARCSQQFDHFFVFANNFKISPRQELTDQRY